MEKNTIELSIIIPSANEMFLKDTIEDILKNKEANTEVIATLDGKWADPPVPIYPHVSIIYVPKSVGMRAASNLAAKLAKGKYILKCDAHCSFDKGFDRKMLEAFKITGDNVTMVPTMRNLHAFNWRCHRCGWTKYQGPTPTRCEGCHDSRFIRRKIIWVGKERPQSNSYTFDSNPHFQYFNEYTKRPEYKESLKKTGITESMSLQGSAFMCTREKYWELKLSDEELGNWGNQGIEVACKTWLSGGRVLVNHNTWYAHMFRTQGEGFGFPWEVSGRDCQKTKNNVRDLFWEHKWPQQTRPLSWLLEKFWPIPANKNSIGWTDDALKSIKESESVFSNLRTEKLGVLGIVPSVPSPMADKATPMSSDRIRK